MQYFTRDESGLSLAIRKDATCFLRWIMSVIPDAVIQAWYQKATRNRALESIVWSININVYRNAGFDCRDCLPELTARNDGKLLLEKDLRLYECHDQKRVELILGGGTAHYSRACEQSGSCWELPGNRILKRVWMKRWLNELSCHQVRVRICGTKIRYTSWFCLIVRNLKRKLISLKMSHQRKWSQAFASV